MKKIPSVLMGKCEFGREDYSFNIVNLPIEREEIEEEESIESNGTSPTTTSNKKPKNNQASLFD
jgi:adenine-specific DNA-methyltransferase